MTKVILPRIPSKLIRLALNDLRICEGQPDKYEIYMGFWYEHYNNKCSICLAGSVMANTTNENFVGTNTQRVPFRDEVNEECYLFLNAMRKADRYRSMDVGCSYIGATPIPWDKEIPIYEDDEKGFHKAMNKLADAFEASGQ